MYVSETIDVIDLKFSEYSFKIIGSKYTQSKKDTTLYGMITSWRNDKGEILTQTKSMDYVPLINDGKIVGKSRALKINLMLGIHNKKQAESILTSLKLVNYKKISLSPEEDGYEVKYESKKYELIYKVLRPENKNSIYYYFTVKDKAYQMIDAAMFDPRFYNPNNKP